MKPANGLVGPVVVVLAAAVLEHGLGFGDVGEVLGVEALVSQPAVERTRRRGSPKVVRARCRRCGCPRSRHQSRSAARDELGAVVHAKVSGSAPLGDEVLDGADDAV